LSGCLSYSHSQYAQRAEAAQVRTDGVPARPGRIYFVSFPENELVASLWGWHPTVGHASLVTCDQSGTLKQYDYGWFVGYDGKRPTDAIGYVDAGESYGVVRRKTFSPAQAQGATNDLAVARMVLEDMRGYGDTVEVWAKGVDRPVEVRYNWGDIAFGNLYDTADLPVSPFIAPESEDDPL